MYTCSIRCTCIKGGILEIFDIPFRLENFVIFFSNMIEQSVIWNPLLQVLVSLSRQTNGTMFCICRRCIWLSETCLGKIVRLEFFTSTVFLVRDLISFFLFCFQDILWTSNTNSEGWSLTRMFFHQITQNWDFPYIFTFRPSGWSNFHLKKDFRKFSYGELF